MVKSRLLYILFLICFLVFPLLADSSLNTLSKKLESAKTKTEITTLYDQIKSIYLQAIVDDNEALRKKAQNLLDQKQTYLASLDAPKQPSRNKTSSSSLRHLLSAKKDKQYLRMLFSHSITSKQVDFLHIKDKKGYKKNIYDIQNMSVSDVHEGKLSNGIRYKIAQFKPKVVRVVFYSKDKFYTSSSYGTKTLAIKTRSTSSGKASQNPPKEALKIQSKATPLLMKRSERVIVIDAGHGGKDCGTRSAGGTCEKGIVLSVSKSVAKELNKMGYTTYLTRVNDKFIKLRSRTQLANKRNADVFVSIHANATVHKKQRAKLKGIETYFLSRARTTRAKNVAAIENQEDLADMDYFSKNTFLNFLNGQRIVASNKLAIDIQRGIYGQLQKKFSGIRDGGVREGPFWVLVGAQMPSVLVEIGYLSHPTESKRLKNPHYQQVLASGIAKGIDAYFNKNI